jgi:uncharacterized membrane protein YdjX (TVP38/TMEM64 family)
MRKTDLRKLHVLIPLALLAAIVTLSLNPQFISLAKAHFSNPQQTAEFLRNQGWAAVLVSICLILINTLLPIFPFMILVGANVLVFGLKLGFVLAWSAAVLGAIAGYWIARLFGRNYFEARLKKYGFVQALESNSHGFRLILLSRLIPVIPNSVVNYGAGISPINFSTYLWATLLGKVPIVAWEAYLANNLIDFHNNLPRLVVMLVLTGVFLIVLWRLYPKLK